MKAFYDRPMTSFTAGFQGELEKLAKIRAIANFAKRLHGSKGLREAIRRSAVLGAGTGAVTGALSESDKSLLHRMLGGAALGAVGGGVTGASFPGWFSRASMLAPDERRIMMRLRGR